VGGCPDFVEDFVVGHSVDRLLDLELRVLD
jgi:hypothetical protein